MGKIPEEVKRFIVEQLACYDTPLQVSEAVKEEFGITVSRQQVQGYDPTKFAGRALSKKWCVIFEETRKKFKAEVSDIPIAQRAFRLRIMQRIASKAESMRNMALALQVLEQVAKEVGDHYVNRRLDPLKSPGPEGGADALPKEEYKILRPDEDVPAKPIL